MQASQIPSKLQIAFAANATGSYVRTVPVPSQVGVTPGAASFSDGFPPLTFLNPSAGGVNVDGGDMNGILKQLSAMLVWYSAGGVMNYDSTFQTAIGGYPKGAILQSALTPLLFWMSTADNNVTDPDAGGAGWQNAYAPPPGTVLALAGPTIPTGYLAVPLTQTLLSTTTYPALFDAVGYNWGGSGSSFGIPYLASGHVPIQGTVGVLSNGQVISHTHTINAYGDTVISSFTRPSATDAAGTNNLSGWIGDTGGTANLAAGRGHQFIVKY